MSIGTILVGLAIIAALFTVYRFVHARSIAAEVEELHRKSLAKSKAKNQRTWDELTNYPDVRVLREKHERLSHTPSYFDHVAKTKD